MTNFAFLEQLSKKAAEANNKEYLKFRDHHSRKSSQINTNEDILHMLLVYLDPYLSSTRKIILKKKGKLSKDVKELLIKDEKVREINNNDDNMMTSENEGESN